MGAVERTTNLPEADVVEIAKGWGWFNPPSGILQVARQAKDASKYKSAEFIVRLGLMAQDKADSLLAAKPSNVQTISWFAQQTATPFPVERVLALKSGYAFYELLALMTVHPCMNDMDVRVRAEELDAAVMLIEDTTPVIVFSTFGTLLKYRSLGRGERMQDVILKWLGQNQLMAVGARDEISAILKSVGSDDHRAGSMESSNLWNAEAAENRDHIENREITRLLDHALKEGATDIALRPFLNGEMQVQLRKYGQMISPKAVNPRMPAELASKVSMLLQAKSGANPLQATLRTPSDGQITYRSSVGDAFLRLSFIPLNHLGDLRSRTSVSIRIFPRTEASISLEELRLAPPVIEEISFSMQMSQGLVLIVGPTNSGKSTTIAGAIGEHFKIYGDSMKRISVEDPIERFLYGITQINALPLKLAGTEEERFGIILRSIKRHDPDMIWIGEVRDKVTADLCVSSAITGHLVLSTLHASNTLAGFHVLAKSVEPDKRYQLVESMSMVISQRLIKELCPKCRVVEAPTDHHRKIFARYLEIVGDVGELPGSIARAKPGGCTHCVEDGYVGLLPINEVLPFTRKVKDAAMAMMNGENTRDLIAGARTVKLLASSLDLVSEHRIDFADLLV